MNHEETPAENTELETNAEPTEQEAQPNEAEANEFEINLGDSPSQDRKHGNPVVTRLIGQRSELREKVSNQDTEIAQLRAENELLKQSRKGPSEKTPKWEDFNSEDDYRESVQEWSGKEQQSPQASDPTAVYNQFRQQEQFQQRVQAHYQKAEELAEKFPDYSQAEEAAIQSLGQGLVQSITQHSHKSAELMLYFGRNPQEAQRFKGLSASDPVGASIELGRLETRLNIQPKQSRPAIATDEPLDGGGGGNALTAQKFEKRLADARSKGSVDAAIAIRKEAAAAGIEL